MNFEEYKFNNIIHISKVDNGLSTKEEDILNNVRIMSFDVKEYLDDIIKSYNYDDNKIIEQFNLDIPRTDVKINNKKIDNVDDIKKELDKYKYDNINIGTKIYNSIILFMVICTQSSYYLPYTLFYKLYSKRGDNNILCSIIDRGDIIIDIIDTIITVKIKGVFALKNTKKNKIVDKVDMSLTFSFNLLEYSYYLYTSRTINLNTSGLIFWNI